MDELDSSKFQGAGPDPFEIRKAIGMLQALAYALFLGTMPAWTPSGPTNLLSGGVSTPSLGTLRVRVPLTPALCAGLSVEVVQLNVAFLLGLDPCDQLGLYVNNAEDRLICNRR